MQLRVSPSSPLLAEARGLLSEMVDLRPHGFAVFLPATTTTDLKAGEETPVGLEVEIPQNADVKTIRIRLNVDQATDLPAAETTSVSVSGDVAGDFDVSVEPSNLPRNVQVRLAGGAPIWSHEGTLPAGAHELDSPELVSAVNAYLDGAQLPPGKTTTTLSFLVKSDTAGRVGLEPIGDPEFTVLQTQTWPNPLDQTVRIDRNLELDFATVARIPLDPPPAGKARPLAGLRLDVSGEAGPERLLGDVPDHDGHLFATVSADYAVAQGVVVASGAAVGLGFQPGGVVKVAGVAMLAAATAETELYVELRRDDAGAPAAGEPLGGVSFTLVPRDDAPGAGWATAPLTEAVELPVDTPHWIVLRGIRAAAHLALAAAAGAGGYLGAVLVNRGGQLWKPLAPGPAFVRVTYLPEPDNTTAPVELALEGGEVQRPELASQPQRIAFGGAGGSWPRSLVVTSHAHGSLAVSNVVQEFGGSS